MKDSADLGLLKAVEFASRRSETLINDPQAVLKEGLEVDRYIGTLKTAYQNEINDLSQLDKPLVSSVNAIVTIIAYHEAPRIRQTLDCFVKQDVAGNSFEIILLDNHPHDKKRDNTHAEVAAFQKENPGISVIYAYRIWQADELATVGNARKYALDIALTRLHARSATHDTVLITNDADTIDLSPNYLSSIVEEFAIHPVTDALVTLNSVPFSAIVKPNLYSILSFWDALDNIVAQGEPYNLIGSTTAYRAATYAAVGGYNPRGKLAGDLETGFLIADARNWNPKSVIQFTKTKHVQDPRRILEAVASRIPVNEMYYKFVSNPEVRNADNEALLKLIPDTLDWELLEDDLTSFVGNGTTGLYKWRGEAFDNDFKAAADRLGVEYEVVNGRVKLLAIDKLLQNYKEEFGDDIVVIHSQPRTLDPQRAADMHRFFLTVTDSAIALRRRLGDRS